MVKIIVSLILPFALLIGAVAWRKVSFIEKNEVFEEKMNKNTNTITGNKMKIKIGTNIYNATLYENKTSGALKAMLPLTLDMTDLNSNEKKFDLSVNLPTNTEEIGTIHEGDILLWGTNTVVLFYKNFDTPYRYTKIGKIDDANGLAAALGGGDVKVSFEIEINTQNMENPPLNAQQQSIVSIASLTAVGNLPSLKIQLNAGLDAGLTINEIKEVLVQMYAYCGFPRCLNGINTFMSVVEDRKAKGISDVVGKDASPIIDEKSKYETGKQTLQKLTGIEEKGTKTGASAFTPVIDTFLKEHLFADIFSRDILTYQQRELATISVLSALDGVAPQLQFHLGVGLNIGLTESQLNQVFSIVQSQIGEKQAEVAKNELFKIKK